MLIENGNITAEMTAGQVQKKYKMFNAYAYRTFSSALQTAVKSRQSEFNAQRPQTGFGGKNGNIKAHTVFSDKDKDYLTYEMSKASLKEKDDEHLYNTRDGL